MKQVTSRTRKLPAIRTASALTTRRTRRGTVRRHRVSVCPATQLPRYRDRHQARQAAASTMAGPASTHVTTFACPDCSGFHLETVRDALRLNAPSTTACAPFTAGLQARKRRYMLIDIENLTRGARGTARQAADLWAVLSQQAPGIAPHDHVVIGASRAVAHKYRPAIHGDNVRWVVGANAHDGADRALLAAVDVHALARDYDELVIASGDHAFAGVARAARALGLTVHVVTVEHPCQSTTLSRELAEATNTRALVRLRSRAQHRANIEAMATVAHAARMRSAAA